MLSHVCFCLVSSRLDFFTLWKNILVKTCHYLITNFIANISVLQPQSKQFAFTMCKINLAKDENLVKAWRIISSPRQLEIEITLFENGDLSFLESNEF